MTPRSTSLFPALLLSLVGAASPAFAAADAAASPAGGQTVTAQQSALLASKPGVALLPNGPGLTTVYGPAFSHGRSPADSANTFIRDHAGAFGAVYADLSARGLNADGAHLLPVSYVPETDSYRFTLVNYCQVRDGLPVWRSDLRLLVRNETNFPLVLAKSALKDLGAFRAGDDLKAKAITEVQANESALGIFPALNEFEPGRLVIFAGSPDVPAAPILAWECIGNGPALADGVPQRWLFIVDAISGAVVYRESLISHVDVTGNVSAWATPTTRAGACDAATLQPMPYARVQISGGNFVHADINGNFTIPHGGSAPVTVTSSPRGQFFRVFNQAGATSELSEGVTPPGPVNFIHNPTQNDELRRAEVDAYIESNVVRDYTLAFNPSFPSISTATEFPVNVNINDSCNAFYNGSSINFFTSGDGCNNTAFSTVVHHEYGHHLVNVAGSGQGAYGEGFGDVMGVIITDESSLGRGFVSCASGIRNANNGCLYSAADCSTCGNAIHTCGQILSGSVWAIRSNLLISNPATYRQIISDLAVNSVLLHQGTTIGNDIVIDFLTLNDDDADITNGTPNFAQIAAGFTAKGFTPPVLPPLAISFPDGRPQLTSPSGGTSMLVQVASITGNPLAGTGELSYDTGSGWVTVPMAHLGQNLYRADFPAATCGTVVRYSVSARTTTNVTVSNPVDAPASFLTTVSATGSEVVFADDFELNRGWTIGAPGDAATSGLWVRTNPTGAYAGNLQSQAEDDVTPAPGVICFVTGNAAAGAAAGQQDVDSGATTLTSPVINLADIAAPKIGYWRWYSNHAGAAPFADTFDIAISNNGGSSWTPVEVVGPGGPQAEGGWYYHEFNVADFVAPTANVRMRFVASDFSDGSLVEAGLDEFVVTGFLCDTFCPGDFDQDGTVAVTDIFAFLAAWFALSPAADLDGVPGVGVPDIFAFLASWFAPCP
jgi:hypothetical protein